MLTAPLSSRGSSASCALFAATFQRLYCADPTVNVSATALAARRNSPALNVLDVFDGETVASVGFSTRTSSVHFRSSPGWEPPWPRPGC
jgi:hypothetical protein